MKKILLASLTMIAFYSTAHPGRTASDGCHYCRTNCVAWGEVAGERHCHNNNSTDQPFFDGMSVKTISHFERLLAKKAKESESDQTTYVKTENSK